MALKILCTLYFCYHMITFHYSERPSFRCDIENSRLANVSEVLSLMDDPSLVTALVKHYPRYFFVNNAHGHSVLEINRHDTSNSIQLYVRRYKGDEDHNKITDIVCVFHNIHLSTAPSILCQNSPPSSTFIFLSFLGICIIILFLSSYILLICISSCFSYKKKDEVVCVS